jgi:xanthine dehydrogenase/oxidase
VSWGSLLCPIFTDFSAAVLSGADGKWHDELLVYINGRRTTIRNVKPETTLLQYLRQMGLTGTKLGCGEVSV